jgi:magnesium-transporting ATPase (P-type)
METKTKNLVKEKNVLDNSTIQKLNLISSYRSGGRWFYWIAGLSLVNTIIYYFGSGMYFVVGLGIMQFVERFFSSFGNLGIIAYIIIDLLIAGVYVAIGYFALKGEKLAFILGFIFYFIDTLLFVYVKDIFSIIFHIYVLFNMFVGYGAFKKLKLGTSEK